MRVSLLAILMFLVALPSQAEDLQVVGIEIQGKGVYSLETGGVKPEENTPTGGITSINKATLITATDRIPAQQGTEFGFQYVLLGSPSGADVTLDMVIIFPEQGLANPDTKETLRESRYSQVKQIGKTEYMGYGFEHDWEAVPGNWVYQIWFNDKILTEQTFIASK